MIRRCLVEITTHVVAAPRVVCVILASHATALLGRRDNTVRMVSGAEVESGLGLGKDGRVNI
jgi:hypothetical protein